MKTEFDKKRFEAFIDAIIAILLTILVLEIKVPENEIESSSTFEQFKSLAPYILSYLASFILIVGFWIDYHLLFGNIKRISLRFILVNMLFIFSLSFTPFITAFSGKNYDDTFAVALLATIYFLINLFFMFIFLDAKFEKLTEPEFWVDNQRVAKYSGIGISALLASIPMAFVNTYISFAIFIFVFSGHLIKKR